MTDQHPITPPPALVQQWLKERPVGEWAHGYLATQAARWGADQELEACVKWIEDEDLRAARRPKPPSLKEQALEELENMIKAAKDFGFGGTDPQAIRKVLEQLDD